MSRTLASASPKPTGHLCTPPFSLHGERHAPPTPQLTLEQGQQGRDDGPRSRRHLCQVRNLGEGSLYAQQVAHLALDPDDQGAHKRTQGLAGAGGAQGVAGVLALFLCDLPQGTQRRSHPAAQAWVAELK